MANMFRTLRADEIDARVGIVKENGISLLLYKDARCDQNILDETVGPFNWKREHSRENANCTVSIWDEKKQQWIGKEDTGTESNTEAEKGLASDSFKRACFNWGIGRELYTAPFIWISGDGNKLKFKRFNVREIAYKDNAIIKLVITNGNGDVVYNFTTLDEDLQPKDPPPADEVKPGDKIKTKFDARKAAADWSKKSGITSQQLNEVRKKVLPDVSWDKMSETEFYQLIAEAKND